MSSRLVIYLDTNFVSLLAKASLAWDGLSESDLRRGKEALAFLTSLVDSHVAIFPGSWVRQHETDLLDHPEFEGAVQKIGARLSRGVWFHSPTTILSNQIQRVFLAHLDGIDYCPTCDEALTNDPRGLIPKWIEESAGSGYAISSSQDRASRQELKRLSVEYRQQRAAARLRPTLSFEQLRAANAWEYVHLIVAQPYVRVDTGGSRDFGDMILMRPAARLITTAMDRGVHVARVGEFLWSKAVLKTPLVDIWASIEASIEVDERSRGWAGSDEYDLQALSEVLPYCDAVFCDQNMKAILGRRGRRSIASRYRTATYSIAEFQQFRTEVEAGPAGPLHAMDSRLARIAESWDKVTEYLVDVARAADPESWSEPSPYPDWSYKDLLAHLATGYTVRPAQLRDLLDSGRFGPEPEVDSAIAGHIARHRRSSPEAVVKEMARQRSEVRRLLGLLRPEHLEVRTTIQRPRDQEPREGPFLETLEHYHEHDLEHAADLAPIMRWPVAPPEV